MRSRWTTVIVVLLSVFVIMVAVGQIFFAGGDEIKTETAFFYDMEEEIPFTGVYLRDETVIYSQGTGVLSYEHEDGSKVGKSSIIARRYKTESEIDSRREIERLKSRIAVLLSAERLIGTDNSQLEAISGQINECHSELISCIQSGNYSEAEAYRDNMLESLCKREITLKECDGYSEKINALQNRVNELEVSLSGDVSDIAANGTGYFVSGVDGYEGELGFSDIESVSADMLRGIISNPVKSRDSRAIGKLISDYRWRTAAVIDTEKMFGINEGSSVTLRVGSNAQLLDAVVVSSEDCGDGQSIYIFECDKLTKAVVQGRTARFKLVVNSYGGLRVSRDAIHYDADGNRGVYIIRGTTLKFRKINVVYWGEDYIICSQEKGDDYLKLYDRIVTQGRDLYDGKVVE